jgi:hypothetical protein
MKREIVLIGGLYVMAIIGCVISYHLGAEVERLKHDGSSSATWRTMSQAHTSATNPAPFDRRRRPICTSDSTGKE